MVASWQLDARGMCMAYQAEQVRRYPLITQNLEFPRSCSPVAADVQVSPLHMQCLRRLHEWPLLFEKKRRRCLLPGAAGGLRGRQPARAGRAQRSA